MSVFQTPGRIIFGAGTISQIGQEAARLGTTALVATGKGSAKASGTLDKVEASLAAAGVKCVIFAEVEQDPTAPALIKAAGIAREAKADVIIGIGGGSALDSAKVIAAAAPSPDVKLEDLSSVQKQNVLPIIAVPTTAGTGSEVTKVAVITFPDTGIKAAIGSDGLVASVAILDPELSMSMPLRVTSSTGMDALTHAMEAYLSDHASPITDLYALSAIKRIGANLLNATLNGKNKEARGQMLLAAMEAGLAFSNASVGLVHAMARPLGAVHHVPHGLANAILLPRVMEFNRPANVARMAEMAVALGANPKGKSLEELSHACVAAVYALLENSGLSNHLRDVKVTEESLPEMAKVAAANQSALDSVRKAREEQVIELYKKCM